MPRRRRKTPRNPSEHCVSRLAGAQKKCPGFTVRFSDPSACGRSLCGQMPRINRLSLAAAAFQPAPGHSVTRVLIGHQHLAGAGNSIRPFARSQRRFRHHCEVKVPGLHLRFPTGNPRESVRLPAPSLRSVSRPNRGDIHARNPLSAPISNVPALSPAPTPLQVLFRKPSGSKRSAGPITGSSSCRTSDCLSLPAASSFDSAADQRC